MARIKRRTYRLCERCFCSLDPGEGRFCSDCIAEMEKEYYARKRNLTMEQARELRRQEAIGA